MGGGGGGGGGGSVVTYWELPGKFEARWARWMSEKTQIHNDPKSFPVSTRRGLRLIVMVIIYYLERKCVKMSQCLSRLVVILSSAPFCMGSQLWLIPTSVILKIKWSPHLNRPKPPPSLFPQSINIDQSRSKVGRKLYCILTDWAVTGSIPRHIRSPSLYADPLFPPLSSLSSVCWFLGRRICHKRSWMMPSITL